MCLFPCGLYAYLHGREMNAKAYARVPLAFGSWQVPSFSDCFLKVALSRLRSKLFKNYWWRLTFRMWNTTVRNKTPR